MIQRVNKIQNLGIFRNYISDSNLLDFARYNLLYGWNGSGKSTLSKLFYFLALNKLPDIFSNCVFNLTTNNGIINSNDLENISLSIQVFNEQFIKENIEWDKLVKSLLYVSKGKIEEKKKLDVLQGKLVDVNRNFDKLSEEIQNIKDNNESFLTDTAREIKKQFEVLRTDDNYYINYDKRKLKKLIQYNPKLKYKRPLVSEKSIEKLKTISKLEFLEELHISIPNKINSVEFDSIIKEANDIIKEDIVSDGLKQLKNNPVISSWVEIGLEIHDGLKKCKFCGNPLSEKRIDRLKKHFNDNYILLKSNIKSIITRVENLKQEPDILPTELELYPFLKESFYKEINLIRNNYEGINKIIDKIVNNLNSKYQNPFNTKFVTIRTPTKIISSINKNIDNLIDITSKHNEITDSFEQKVGEAKKQLE